MKVIRSTIIPVFAVVLFSLLSTASIYAEDRAGAFSITPFAGGMLFDKDLNHDTGPLAGVGLGYYFTDRVGAELSFARVFTQDDPEDETLRSEDTRVDLGRLELLCNLVKDSGVVPYLALGAGAMNMKYDRHGLADNRDVDFITSAGLGLKVFICPDAALRFDVRHIWDPRGENGPTSGHNLLATAGIAMLFGGKTKAAPVAVQPEPVREPEPAKVVEAAPADSDGDGIIDKKDKCPDTPAGVAVDRNGCPRDSDKDGVWDSNDKCPDTPAGAAVNDDGCPKDSDGDGVADYLDKCPDTPADTKVDKTGCPLPVATVTKEGAYNFGNIYFDTGKDTIKPKSRPVLDGVVDYMNANPGVKLEVQGNTDNVGPDKPNQKLSEKRAAAVKKYLVGKGIAADRLTAKGYGESKPAEDNATKEGRAKNRRIDFMPIQ
jgi:OmpA-OmpF porin, OOP family